MPFAVPTEVLLASGGDSRLLIDPTTRLNKYGCSSSPRPEAITFSNCTASSPSDLGFRAAEQMRQSMLTSCLAIQDCIAPFTAAIEQCREELYSALSLNNSPGTEVLLAASGTDCESYALDFALADHDVPVTTIVIAPDEIGSGSMQAAQGLHFDKSAPLKREVSRAARSRAWMRKGCDVSRSRFAIRLAIR